MSTIISPEFAAQPYEFYHRWHLSIHSQARECSPHLDSFTSPNGTADLLGLFMLPEVSNNADFATATAGRTTHTTRATLDQPILEIADDATAAKKIEKVLYWRTFQIHTKTRVIML